MCLLINCRQTGSERLVWPSPVNHFLCQHVRLSHSFLCPHCDTAKREASHHLIRKGASNSHIPNRGTRNTAPQPSCVRMANAPLLSGPS